MRTQISNLLRRLARLHGIQPVAVSQFVRILGLRGVQATSPQRIRQALREAVARKWRTIAPASLVIRSDHPPPTWSIHLPIGGRDRKSITVTWSLRDEAGHERHYTARNPAIVATIQLGGQPYVKLALPFPKRMQVGTYHIYIEASTPRHHWVSKVEVMATPARCYLPTTWRHTVRRANSPPQRHWGLTLQLYGVQSTRNWGIGDFRDLCQVIWWAPGWALPWLG